MAHVPAIENDSAVGERQDEIEMVLDDHDRDLTPQPLDRHKHFVDHRWRKPLEGFVEQQ